MTLPKPTPPIRAKREPIRPKCVCGHAKRLHTCAPGCTDDWCEKCGAECQTYRPSLSVRKPVPVARKEGPKRKKRPNKVRKTGRAALGRLADKLCGALVRSRGACEECGRSAGVVLQWAHGFSRRYHATRWLPINGFCLCSGDHYKFGLRPLEFDCWLRERWGQPVYDELRRIALENKRVDLEATVAALREEARERGVE